MTGSGGSAAPADADVADVARPRLSTSSGEGGMSDLTAGRLRQYVVELTGDSREVYVVEALRLDDDSREVYVVEARNEDEARANWPIGRLQLREAIIGAHHARAAARSDDGGRS